VEKQRTDVQRYQLAFLASIYFHSPKKEGNLVFDLSFLFVLLKMSLLMTI
jgi:hypothetical protein